MRTHLMMWTPLKVQLFEPLLILLGAPLEVVLV